MYSSSSVAVISSVPVPVSASSSYSQYVAPSATSPSASAYTGAAGKFGVELGVVAVAGLALVL